MTLLLLASLIWAFSFGLIKHELAGVNPLLVTFVRLAISLLVFIPLARSRGLSSAVRLRLAGIGGIQYGIMYLAYIVSFRFLDAYQVALFTVLTPIYVTVLADLREGRGKVSRFALLAAALAAVGSAVIVAGDRDPRGSLSGCLLLQASNLCFAFGQVEYRRLMRKLAWMRDRDVFAWLYLGAAAVAALPLLALGVCDAAGGLDARRWLVLIYLGAIPSGLAFFLWNAGARRSGAGALAVMNNAKIPLAVFVSLIVFGESASLPSLLVGAAAVLAAAVLCRCREAGWGGFS
jgi:drug/metabolite transporter (DMT)-like permease